MPKRDTWSVMSRFCITFNICIMKTLKLDQFEKFECKASQMDKVRGGESVKSGTGRDATTGDMVEETCHADGTRTFKKL